MAYDHDLEQWLIELSRDQRQTLAAIYSSPKSNANLPDQINGPVTSADYNPNHQQHMKRTISHVTLLR